MKLKYLGLLGVISLLSYSAMVFFSPLAYPGYNWLTMAVSDLSAVGAPSEKLASQLNALFGPCGIVSIMAVVVGVYGCKSRVFKLGIYLFAAMEWVTNVGYKLFPLVEGAGMDNFQNIMHIVVTVLVVVLSIASLVLLIIGARLEKIKSLSIWASVCLGCMCLGAIGTGALPKAVFGLFERFSCFSAIVFNAILGIYLFLEKYQKQEKVSVN